MLLIEATSACGRTTVRNHIFSDPAWMNYLMKWGGEKSTAALPNLRTSVCCVFTCETRSVKGEFHYFSPHDDLFTSCVTSPVALESQSLRK